MFPRYFIQKAPVSRRVNIYYPPIADKRLPAKNGADITKGDLHASATKTFYILKRHQFYFIDDADYAFLVHLCNTPREYVTTEDFNKFQKILFDAKLNPEARDALLRFMGDDLADRNITDLWQLFNIVKMDTDKLYFIVIGSNHTMNFIRCVETGSKFEAPSLPLQSQSIYNLQYFIDRGFITTERIREIYEKHYLPHLKIIDYKVREDGRLMLFAHGSFGDIYVSEFLEDLNAFLSEEFEFKNDTPENYIVTLDAIQEKFMRVARMKKIHLLYDFGNGALRKLFWSREYNPEKLGQHPDYFYFHAHDLGWTDESLPPNQRVLQPNEWNKNVCSLDNRLGFSDLYSKYYHYDDFDPDENYSIAYFSNEKKFIDDTVEIDTAESAQNEIKALLAEKNIQNIILPQYEDKNYYLLMYDLFALLDDANLLTEKNLQMIFSCYEITYWDNLNVFYFLLIELRQGKLLNQEHLAETIAKDIPSLRNSLTIQCLINYVNLLNFDINPDLLNNPHFCLKLHELLKQLNNYNLINYNYLKLIFTNLNMLDQLYDARQDQKKLTKYIQAIEKKEIILLLKSKLIDSGVAEENTSNYLPLLEHFNANQLYALLHFLNLSKAHIEYGIMHKETLNAILFVPDYLEACVHISSAFSTNFDLWFQLIYCKEDALSSVDLAALVCKKISDPLCFAHFMAETTILRNKGLFTSRLFRYLAHNLNPYAVIDIIKTLRELNLLTANSIDMVINSEGKTSTDELINLIKLGTMQQPVVSVTTQSIFSNSNTTAGKPEKAAENIQTFTNC